MYVKLKLKTSYCNIKGSNAMTTILSFKRLVKIVFDAEERAHHNAETERQRQRERERDRDRDREREIERENRDS